MLDAIDAKLEVQMILQLSVGNKAYGVIEGREEEEGRLKQKF